MFHLAPHGRCHVTVMHSGTQNKHLDDEEEDLQHSEIPLISWQPHQQLHRKGEVSFEDWMKTRLIQETIK